MLLEIGAEAATRSLVASRLDPLTGVEYHPDETWPTDPKVASRLVQHPLKTEPAVAAALKSWEARE